jgi:tRNA U34 5-methylaminomethyl-2-thiouridine-forming methyltransferase MnmC
MKREVVNTADGSKTIRIIDLDENYHSSHGALQEAEHVFIKYGLLSCDKDNINIFEMGFGTGLNAFLTAKHNLELGKTIFYHGVEAYPVNSIELEALGYNKLLGDDYEQLYTKIHKVKWDDIQWINERLSLLKSEDRLQELELKSFFYDVIYYDAFGPRAQDEMWSIELFEKMYKCLQKGGFLVTYCAKGQVKRNMKAVGFEIEPLPGPPGKREMTRAWKR